MCEPDVTLTDYGLAVECAICATSLGLAPAARKGLQNAGMCFYIFLGISAAAGGTVNGFCPGLQSPECRWLWQLTLQSVGLAAFSTWVLGASILATGPTERWLARAAFPQLALYSSTVLFFTQDFWIVFMIYLPAALLLLAGFCRAAWCDGHWFLLVGAAGSMFSFASSYVQFMRIGIDPVTFNHNALAHIIQAVALLLMLLGIRYVVGSAFAEPRAGVRSRSTS
jgi:hypothetical protein